MLQDSTAGRLVAADRSVSCRARCRTCFRMRTVRLQRLIRSQPVSITRRSARSMHISMTCGRAEYVWAERRRGARRISTLRQTGRNHSRAGNVARHLPAIRVARELVARRHHHRQSVWPRRQRCPARCRFAFAMSRIRETFAELKRSRRGGFIPFITAGDPDLANDRTSPN